MANCLARSVQNLMVVSKGEKGRRISLVLTRDLDSRPTQMSCPGWARFNSKHANSWSRCYVGTEIAVLLCCSAHSPSSPAATERAFVHVPEVSVPAGLTLTYVTTNSSARTV